MSRATGSLVEPASYSPDASSNSYAHCKAHGRPRMKRQKLGLAQKTREFERVDQALLVAKTRLKILEAAGSNALAINQARAQVAKLTNEREALRAELEKLDKDQQ